METGGGQMGRVAAGMHSTLLMLKRDAFCRVDAPTVRHAGAAAVPAQPQFG
jgi:hypothetical protein